MTARRRPWWRREIEDARASADRAEREQGLAVQRRQVAEAVDKKAKGLESQLRSEMLRNGFAEALRTAFGSA